MYFIKLVCGISLLVTTASGTGFGYGPGTGPGTRLGTGPSIFGNGNQYKNQFGSKPYEFGYVAAGHDGSHFRKEKGDPNGSVRGSYGYSDNKGLFRKVDYVADASGFHAAVRTNEPGTSGKENPANVQMFVQPPPQGNNKKSSFGPDYPGIKIPTGIAGTGAGGAGGAGLFAGIPRSSENKNLYW